MPCFASSLLDSNRRQRALQISAGPIGQGDYYQPVRCLVLVYELSSVHILKAGIFLCSATQLPALIDLPLASLKGAVGEARRENLLGDEHVDEEVAFGFA